MSPTLEHVVSPDVKPQALLCIVDLRLVERLPRIFPVAEQRHGMEGEVIVPAVLSRQ